jgi:NAD(P)-dependent dehydrogenase (short-subunit alcohol dehydrogenase family)
MGSALDGRVAVVTGAGRGIGREIAIGLAAAGARVALLARTQTQLDEVAETIQKAAGTSIKIAADLSDQQSWRPAVDETVRLLGRIDILINNAAVVVPLGPTQTLEPDDVQAALTINVGAAVVLAGLVLPGMLTHGWGRIINISSGIAEHPAAMIGGNVYAATKAALEAHTLNLAAELDGTGITVNAYRPGAVDTAMQAWIRNQSPDAIGHALHDRFVSSHASGELLSPEVSAARLLERLTTSESGRIWSVSDPPITGGGT